MAQVKAAAAFTAALIAAAKEAAKADDSAAEKKTPPLKKKPPAPNKMDPGPKLSLKEIFPGVMVSKPYITEDQMAAAKAQFGKQKGVWEIITEDAISHSYGVIKPGTIANFTIGKGGGGTISGGPIQGTMLNTQKESLSMSDLTKAAASIAEALAPQLASKLAPNLAKEFAALEDTTAHAKQGKAEITVTQPDGSEHKAVEMIGKPKLFAGPTCEVGFAAGTTMNLGNYSSARIDISVKIPCAHVELDAVFDYAKSWVDKHMTEVTKNFTPDLKKA